MSEEARDTAVEAAPVIELRQTAAEQAGPQGEWNINFLLRNLGADTLQLLTVRLPHGQFRGDELSFGPTARLAPSESFTFSSRVRCHEPPGPVTENAFIILMAAWRETRWRIFVRIRVVVDGAGVPHAVTEAITTQKVGFSGIDN